MLLQIEVLCWVVSGLIIVIVPLIWIARFIKNKYFTSSLAEIDDSISDDIITSQVGEVDVTDDIDQEDSEPGYDEELSDDVQTPVYVDPVIAAMYQEEEQFAREQEQLEQEEMTDNIMVDDVDSESSVIASDLGAIDTSDDQEDMNSDVSMDDVVTQEQMIEDVVDVIEIDVDGDGQTDAVATIHTTAPADLIEAKRQKSIEMLQFELRTLKEKGQAPAHEKKLIEARALHPERVEFTTMLADHYYDQSEYKKSLGLYRTLVSADSSDDKSLSMIANCYIKLGEWENAQVILEKLVQDKPENPRYWMSLAEVYYNFKYIDQAVDCVRMMVKLRPTNMDYLSTLAQLYHETENYESYVQILYRMLELDPLNHEIKAEIEKYT